MCLVFQPQCSCASQFNKSNNANDGTVLTHQHVEWIFYANQFLFQFLFVNFYGVTLHVCNVCYGPASVCPSVHLLIHNKSELYQNGKNSIMETVPCGCPGTLVFLTPKTWVRILIGATNTHGQETFASHFGQITRYISKTVQDKHVVSMKGEQEVVFTLLNGDTCSDLEWVVFGSRDFKLWEISDGISETIQDRDIVTKEESQETRHRARTSTRQHFVLRLCCHSNETRTPIANSPNSAQLEGTPTIPPTYVRVRAVVWECSEGQTHTQTHATNIHFALATSYARCNNMWPMEQYHSNDHECFIP